MATPYDNGAVKRLRGVRLFWEGYGLSDQNSGVGVCATRLHSAFESIGLSPEQLLAKPGQKQHSKPLTAAFSALRIRKSLSSHRDQQAILHGLSNFNVPMFRVGRGALRYVLTVHDIIPVTHPGFVSRALGLQMRAITPLAFAAADAIVCSSKFTENEVLRRYPVAKGKCFLIPLGREKTKVRSPSNENRSETAVQVLSVGRDEPYKMLALAIEILTQAPKNWTLTIVTNLDGQLRLQDLARGSQLADRIKILSGLPNQSLENLFRQCDVYLHPSLVEGYCLPAAEALGNSKPVVYRSGTVLEETVGPCGIGVPSTASPSEWVDAMESAVKLGRSPEYQEKLEIFSNSSFSWADCAFSYARVYDSLVG